MNTNKKVTIRCIFVLIILIASGGLWQSTAAKSGVYPLEAGETIGLGRQGLHITGIPHGTKHVSLETMGDRLPVRFDPSLNLERRSPVMEVRFLTEQGEQVDQISALVYVFFNLDRGERRMWNKGGVETIAIWYASFEIGRWEICPTFLVDSGRGRGSFGRLACLAPGSGAYVLGQGDFGEYLARHEESSAVGQEPATLNVLAYIDGRSWLILRGGILYWHHLDFAAPGRHPDAEVCQPTYLNRVAWEPVWPDAPDSENRDCDCDSSAYRGIAPLASTSQQVGLEMLRARGAVKVIQQPAAANDFTLIIELDDNPLDGPDWYEINLDYQSGSA